MAMSCIPMAVQLLLVIISVLFLASIWQPMVVAGSAPSDGYRLELIHVDSNGNFTREEVIRRAMNRTRLRAAMLLAEEDQDTALSGLVKIPMEYSPHSYLMKLKMGTLPETTFLAVADTGSEIVWTKQMKMCTGSPSFSPTNWPCAHECRTTSTHCNTCMVNKLYGDGRWWMKGFTGMEMLDLPTSTEKKKKQPEVSLVCAIEWTDEMLPPSSQGIVGLSRGPMSLVRQLGITKFSYCLTDPLKPNLISPLWLGDVQPTGKDGWRSTPLVPITTSANNKYYVELDGICVEHQCREPLQRDDFKFKSQSKGAMMLDSGTTYTALDTKVFDVLKELLLTVLDVPVVRKNGLDCFEKHIEKSPTDYPDLVLKFTRADMRLPWANYVSTDPKTSDQCLNIEGSKMSILGSMQQRNMHMLYDLAKEQLSFKSVDDCGKL